MTLLIPEWIGCHRKRIALLASAVLVAVATAYGQGTVSAASAHGANADYVPTLTFDVASVRQSPPANSYRVSGGFTANTSILRATNFDLRNLLGLAYASDRYYRVEGIPDSFGWAMFNIEAKADEAADEKLAKLTGEQAHLERQHMVQVLLAERFNLKIHWETKEGDVYNLVVKNPSKLHASTGAPPSAEELKVFGERPVPALYQRGDSRTGFDFVAHGCSIDMLMQDLAGQFGRPVIDKTGLTGKYDFVLSYFEIHESQRDAADMNPLPPLETAIQDQLGLKLEPAKGPIPVLVVDHVEMPSQN